MTKRIKALYETSLLCTYRFMGIRVGDKDLISVLTCCPGGEEETKRIGEAYMTSLLCSYRFISGDKSLR